MKEKRNWSRTGWREDRCLYSTHERQVPIPVPLNRAPADPEPTLPLTFFGPRKEIVAGIRVVRTCLQVPWFPEFFCHPNDVDPGPQDPVLWLQYTNTHGLQKSCGGKGTAWPLSKWERVWGPERAQEREPTPTWTGFYCFSGHITWRMVLIYYAQVHHRWLPFKDNKGQNAANYFKEKNVTAQGEKWLNWLYSCTWVV